MGRMSEAVSGVDGRHPTVGGVPQGVSIKNQ
jgi:hypothetical protein